MKKSIIITLCLIISMLSTSVVFAMDNETIKAETEDEEIINVDMNSLDLSKSKKIVILQNYTNLSNPSL